jgi:hypothetical protein
VVRLDVVRLEIRRFTRPPERIWTPADGERGKQPLGRVEEDVDGAVAGSGHRFIAAHFVRADREWRELRHARLYCASFLEHLVELISVGRWQKFLIFRQLSDGDLREFLVTVVDQKLLSNREIRQFVINSRMRLSLVVTKLSLVTLWSGWSSSGIYCPPRANNSLTRSADM